VFGLWSITQCPPHCQWRNYKFGPPAKAAKHGHRAPVPAIEQFEVNCAASISTTMHSLQLCREKNGGGVGTRAPDPRGPPCVAESAGQLLCHCLLQRSTKWKISHWYFLISVFTPSRLHLLSKTPPASAFLRIFFTHIHLMTCLSSMVNHIAVTTLWLNALVSAWSPPRNPTARPGPLTDGEGLATPSEEPYPAVLGISVLTVPTTEKSSVRHCCDRGHVMAVQWQSRWCTESYCSEPPERRPEWWGAVRRS